MFTHSWMIKQFYFKQLCLARVHSLKMVNSSTWPIDRILSGATSLDQSGPGGDGNEGVLHIPPCSSITWATQSDCLVSYQGHSLVGYLSLCWQAVSVFYSSSQLEIREWCMLHIMATHAKQSFTTVSKMPLMK